MAIVNSSEAEADLYVIRSPVKRKWRRGKRVDGDFNEQGAKSVGQPIGPGQSVDVRCPQCDKLFKYESILKSHMKAVHEVEPCVCATCNKQFKNEVLMRAHEKRHTIGMELCELCGKEFKCIAKHMSSAHSETGATCDACGKMYASQVHLNLHKLNVHRPTKPHVCDRCNAAFTTRSALTKHFASHSDVKNYKCSLCEKSFKFNYVLTAHQRVHGAAEPYTCNNCGAIFKWRQTLMSHLAKCPIRT